MKLYFDILIFTSIIAVVLPAFILMRNKIKLKNSWEQKHPKSTITISSILLFFALCIIYGSFIEPKLLTVNHKIIDIEGIENEIKIAFIADFQVGPYKQEAHLKKLIGKIEELNPDLVLIGGDQIMNDGSSLSEFILLTPLRDLAKKYPTYAVHGNHEYGVGRNTIEEDWVWLPDLSENTKWYAQYLGINYLTNDLEKINIKNENFYLFGGDSLLANKLDTEVLNERTEEIPTIALIHHPLAVKELANKKVDLLLSGHTHGGQLRLPFIGPFGKIEAKIPIKWYQGFSKYKDVRMFITSGTGETGARSRFLNPPEIVLLTIK
ncbi:MAG: metallophosphoesterase [Candidatus Magasanikbacteria bacterium]|nr:metallophosphoesterase [Candidatus Magasanikbacteria bacterium]